MTKTMPTLEEAMKELEAFETKEQVLDLLMRSGISGPRDPDNPSLQSSCPLAKYLQQVTGDTDVKVSLLVAYIGVYNGHGIALPKGVYAFREAFDTVNYGRKELNYKPSFLAGAWPSE